MKSLFKSALLFAVSFFAVHSYAQTSNDIVDVAVSSPNHTTLVAAVKAADLVETLKSKGPFTVFAPVNEAFAKLPAGTVETLLLPENKAKLSSILTYHVVSGNLTATDVLAAIKKGKGKVVLTTVNGAKLTASLVKGKVTITDENGGKSTVTATDLKASNGVIHVIDTVLLPK
ncbi:MAG TPA: fasciclin domain-containing protein [Chitinophagales bacterium]|jgi:uncharacterized surface protein with fasciclin (FAS1) repeats|nr:fasciclin domain-containing protein [Chitinophagales bacterium]